MARPPPDPVHILHNASGSVTALCTFGTTSKHFLVSGSETGYVTVWNLMTYRPAKTWKAHDSSIIWLECIETTSLIITYGRRESVTVWNDKNKAILKIPVSHDCFCKCDTLGPLLAVPHEKNEVRLFNIEGLNDQMKIKLSVSNDEGAIFIIKLLAVDKLLTAYESGGVFMWNLTNCKIEAQARIGHLPNCAAHNSERNEILIGTSSETLFVFDDRDLKLLRQVPLVNPGLNAILVRPTDRRLYATAGWDKRIRIFSAKSHKKLCVLQVHEGAVNALAYVMDSRTLLAAGGSDGLISLWDLYNNDLNP